MAEQNALPDDPATAILVLADRFGNMADDVAEIKRTMATKEGQGTQADAIDRLTNALALEAENRARAISDAKSELKEQLAAERVEREKVAARLQLVEDRLESRKFQSLIGILLGGLGVVFGVISRFIQIP